MLQAPLRTPLKTRLCWWGRPTVTTSAKTDSQEMCWRPAAADLLGHLDPVPRYVLGFLGDKLAQFYVNTIMLAEQVFSKQLASI